MHSTNRVFAVSVALIFSVFSLVAGAVIADAFAGQTTRVSVSSSGDPANAAVTNGVLSADGRYVVFQSNATNLVTGVSGLQVYRHDRVTGTTVLVSIATAGGPGNNTSRDPSVSADGRFVVFGSFATDLVDGDTNSQQDVFVRDMDTGTTTLVSAASAGVAGLPGSSSLSGLPGARGISDDGRYVAFSSTATNLVAEANNGVQQIYVKDTTTGAVVRASVDGAGQAGDRSSSTPAISGNGQVVAFRSNSTNLSPLSTSGTTQVFARDLVTGATTLESAGAAAVGRPATAPALSFDGRYVAFESAASLDPRDLDGGTLDVFLRDRVADTTVLASLSNTALGGATSASPSISGDGRWVGFQSLDNSLVAVDTNGLIDVFLYDRDSQIVTLVSLNDAGEQADAHSTGASVSFDGQLVLFGSAASNLVASASNGFTQLYVRKLVEDEALVTIEWLAPLSDSFLVDRTLPVKFIVRGEDGSPVLDDSVRVDVVDLSGVVVAGPYFFGDQPSRSVAWNGDFYHVNVDTKDVGPGMYTLRVRFSSPTLTAEFGLDTNGITGAVRSRPRD